MRLFNVRNLLPNVERWRAYVYHDIIDFAIGDSRFPRERNEAANRSQTSSNEARFAKISRCLIIHMTKKYSVVLNKIYIVQHLLLRTF